MPSPDTNCSTLGTIVSNKLPSCFPNARVKIEQALEAILGLVCWDLQSCYLASTPGQLLAGNVDTKIFWDVVVVDTNALYTIGSGDILIRRKGIYAISSTAAWQPAANSDHFTMRITVNDVPKAQQSVQGRTDKVAFNNAAVTLQLLVGEIVRVYVEYSNLADPDADLLLAGGSQFFLDMVQPL